jgi:hypothetical protein
LGIDGTAKRCYDKYNNKLRNVKFINLLSAPPGLMGTINPSFIPIVEGAMGDTVIIQSPLDLYLPF